MLENHQKCLNFNANFSPFLESPQWLASFCGNFSDWTGVSLIIKENNQLRKRIVGKTPSLLDVRNYLFARQSQLLLQMNKPWEVSRKRLENTVYVMSFLCHPLRLHVVVCLFCTMVCKKLTYWTSIVHQAVLLVGYCSRPWKCSKRAKNSARIVPTIRSSSIA